MIAFLLIVAIVLIPFAVFLLPIKKSDDFEDNTGKNSWWMGGDI